MLGTLQRARGGWVSRAELFADSGSFYLSNNAASELNAKGWNVEHRVVKGLHSYRLVGLSGLGGTRSVPPGPENPDWLTEPEQHAGDLATNPAAARDHGPRVALSARPGSVSQLFDTAPGAYGQDAA